MKKPVNPENELFWHILTTYVMKGMKSCHGFKKEDGWSSLTPSNTSLVAIKLENITQEIGLKSP